MSKRILKYVMSKDEVAASKKVSVVRQQKESRGLKNFVTPEKAAHHAQILANRVRNRYRHLRRRFARQQIEYYRLYDWDIPEVRAVVDWVAGHLVVAEYERLQTGPEWLPLMAKAVGEVLEVPAEKVFIKRRRTQQAQGSRYKRTPKGEKGVRIEIHERDLKFWVNLSAHLDTGLFSDHRNTRVLVRKMAKGQDFLNLFAYTGAFTCAAAAGGVKSSITVDRSATYLAWARENMKLNGLTSQKHQLMRSDTEQCLEKLKNRGQRFTLAFVDPPSFSQRRGGDGGFDVNRHHPELLNQVLDVMVPGGTIIFSTNHQRFDPKLNRLPVKNLKELTPATIPEDYRNRQVHRCWCMTK